MLILMSLVPLKINLRLIKINQLRYGLYKKGHVRHRNYKVFLSAVCFMLYCMFYYT